MLRETCSADGVAQARSDVKSRMRLNQTTIQPGENNPLKFSPSVDDAVLKLLDPHSSRYLGPIDAIASRSRTSVRTRLRCPAQSRRQSTK
jgi:type VI secretion system protein